MRRSSIRRWLPVLMGGGGSFLPYTVDFSTLSDGALPDVFAGGTWTISSQKAINTPTLGGELWESNAATFEGESTYGWVASGTNTIANVANALAITYVDNATGAVDGFLATGDLSSNLTVGNFYRCGISTKINSGTFAVNLTHGATAGYSGINGLTETELTAHTLDFRCGHATAGSVYMGAMGAGEIVTVDNMSLKPFTLSGLLNVVTTQVTSDPIVKAGWNVTAGHLAGVVACVDSATTPLYGIFAYIDTNQLIMTKLVNGTFTPLIRTAITYSAGADVEIRKNGTQVAAYYNNAQIGTTQTIEDAALIGNKLHGLFSTDPTNTADNFSVVFF